MDKKTSLNQKPTQTSYDQSNKIPVPVIRHHLRPYVSSYWRTEGYTLEGGAFLEPLIADKELIRPLVRQISS